MIEHQRRELALNLVSLIFKSYQSTEEKDIKKFHPGMETPSRVPEQSLNQSPVFQRHAMFDAIPLTTRLKCSTWISQSFRTLVTLKASRSAKTGFLTQW
jgi:hypothetical protein